MSPLVATPAVASSFPNERRKIAIIGSGVSGLSTAWHLLQNEKVRNTVEITLFEADNRLGGHAYTIDVTLDGITSPADMGFLVCNERTYPHFIPFLKSIDVPLVPTDMSFAVSVGPHEFEWCGSDLLSVFAQARNIFSPRFWVMLRDIIRFNKEATALAVVLDSEQHKVPLGQWLNDNNYSKQFRDDYLIPMAAAIWSCPTKTMLEFPLGSFVRFFNNHGLLQITNRPRWFTVLGGSKRYVDKIAQTLISHGGKVLTSTPVKKVRRSNGMVRIEHGSTSSTFDEVVLACHSDQALALLGDARHDETQMLSAIPYQANTAWLHTDQALMPKRRKAWAAWNYLSVKRSSDQEQSVAVTYWLNKLQPLPFKTPLLLTLNPLKDPDPTQVIRKISYEHPVFDARSTQAQQALEHLQGKQQTWFAGAWTGYGFHEDGFRSGYEVAQKIASTLVANQQVIARAA